MFKKNINFPATEEEIVKFWKKNNTFQKTLEESKDKPKFIFFDGPPFATGLPHYGHILSGSIKDTVGRFWHQQGFHVGRRFGWDCHGLPVEYEIDKLLNITDRQQVLDMGIAKYNDECKSIVLKYTDEWEKTVTRMGRWVDFRGGYKTMDITFMESTWFIFKQLWERNKIYRGYRVMPFSTACKTPLSNFEANLNFKEVSDPSVLIAFPLVKPLNGLEISLVAWTTTPWTLPSNCALLINETFEYSIFEYKEKNYVAHANRIPAYFKDYKVIGSVAGKELVGLEYSQPFDFFEHLRAKRFFRILPADFVSDTDGTAIVHCAPAFGEEDYKSLVAHGLIGENDEVPCPVDENGKFTLGKYKGIYVKELDKIILKDIKERVLMNNSAVHSYPFCWRSDTPLIYRLVSNWFVKVAESREDLLRCNEEINWIPQDIKYKRFHNWLSQARDWSISRNRFWGTPLPVWTTEDYSEMLCVGSIAELEELSGRKITDLHRQYIDDIVIEKNGKKYKRVEEVLDCWFESGSMPYSQEHWPFSEKDTMDQLENLELNSNYLKKDGFPAQFIGEGLDQCRGWFYTLHVISTLLFNKPAFKNVVVNGIVLAEDGKKMSKRLKNYPDPAIIFNQYGADSLRLFLLSTPVVEAEDLRFSENGVKEILKVLLIPWYNTLSFYVDCAEGDQETEMDPWILSSFNKFCYNVDKTMKSYKMNPVLGFALSFIDDLSNWYIRINRKALRTGSKLLCKLLKEFSIVMAPFAPFFSEYCYQCVKTAEDPCSVHQCMYPTTKPTEHPFSQAKKVIEGIRQMREKHKLKIKRPLKGVSIVCADELAETLKNYMHVIQSECNVLSLEFHREDKFKFHISVKPFFDNLKLEKETMKKKIEVIRNLSDEQAMNVVEKPLTVCDVVITNSDVLVSKEFVGVENSATFGSFGLILDVEINTEIIEMTDAREVYSFIQKLRKECGLVPTDKVAVSIANSHLTELISKNYNDVILGNEGKLISEVDYSYSDSSVKICLYKTE